MTHNRPLSAILTIPASGRLFTAAVTQTMVLTLCVAALVCQVSPTATQNRTIEFLLEQVTAVGRETPKPMFGEYGVYLDGKMIGSGCDDQLFIKPTASGRAHAEPVSDAPPYPGAKPQILIAADRWDDAEWLSESLRITAIELPTPKPIKPKQAA